MNLLVLLKVFLCPEKMYRISPWIIKNIENMLSEKYGDYANDCHYQNRGVVSG